MSLAEDPLANLDAWPARGRPRSGWGGVLLRQVRSAIFTALGSDYVRTAGQGSDRTAGGPDHALRNSLITVVTILGLSSAR